MSSSGADPPSEADLRSRLDKLEWELYSHRIAPTDHPFDRICLTVGQVVSFLGEVGCASCAIIPFWCFLKSPWNLLVFLGALIGFFYSAAMWTVFTRVKKMK
jgi:hypothetical protein